MSRADDRVSPASQVDVGACDPVMGCALCGDEALPARVVQIDATTDTARVTPLDPSSASPAAFEVALDLVSDVAVDDIVLVHQGFAIQRVSGT
jgi:hydrogenase maturation factor